MHYWVKQQVVNHETCDICSNRPHLSTQCIRSGLKCIKCIERPPSTIHLRTANPGFSLSYCSAMWNVRRSAGDTNGSDGYLLRNSDNICDPQNRTSLRPYQQAHKEAESNILTPTSIWKSKSNHLASLNRINMSNDWVTLTRVYISINFCRNFQFPISLSISKIYKYPISVNK